jgi:alkylation response protein AidB-like acyl-CoA dehydrogenase
MMPASPSTRDTEVGAKPLDFQLSDQQQTMRRTLHELLTEICPPDYVQACDESGDAPRRVFEALAHDGWLGVAIPQAYGGRGGDAIDLAILLETTGHHYVDLGTWIFRNYCYGADAILKSGSDELKAQIIPLTARGEAHFAFSLTEPDAGSDAAAIITAVDRDGDNYRIRGAKNFTSGMPVATHILVAARTDATGAKHQGITNFIVPADRDGISWDKLSLLGHRAMGTSVVHYDDVHASPREILGELNEGWSGLMAYLTTERLCLSAVRIGAAASALTLARASAAERLQRDRSTEAIRGLRRMLTEMHLVVESARLRVYRFAWLVSRNRATRIDAASLKLFAGEAYQRVAELGLGVVGVEGIRDNSAMQRHYRDAQLATIGAGTSEVQRNIIAKAIGL